MKIYLEEVPFSTRGSYMAFSYLKGNYRGREVKPGLYFRTVHGDAHDSLTARIYPTWEGKEIEYTYEAVPWEVTIKAQSREARIAFADAETILIQGNLPLTFDFMSQGREFTFVQPYKSGEREFYMINAFIQKCRYMIWEKTGNLKISQNWKVSTSEYCMITLGEKENETYMAVIEENKADWSDRKKVFSYHETVLKQREEFESFRDSMPSIPEAFAEAAETAAYVNWASIVKPWGILRREAMFMSKNWMCNVWSWDHCFNAIAMAYKNPKEAWDQFMLMFDFQSETGRIPDSVNDVEIVNNYCKPPIHGWTLRKLEQIMEISREQLLEAYEKIGKWTNWWLNNRDENGDGLCEYTHGNDSGWDNSTAFSELPPITSPDLAAFLVLQMDVLSETAENLGLLVESEMWKCRAENMLKRMLETLFKDGLPRVLAGFDMKEVKTESLLLYLPIVLGERLPKEIRENLIGVLKGEKFNTMYGLATESPQSPEYEADGYWRGPIWAPSTMLILDGMAKCKELEYVKAVAEKFCRMVQKSGCAENFDALTGEGLRDRAYTWTASAMLVMAHEYLMG